MTHTKTKSFISFAVAATFLVQATFQTAYAAVTKAPDYEERQLIATAYYSPLPNQSFYLRGSYEADVKLNGNGTNGASGKEVFVGMIAAPKTYDFGTKIWIEWLGLGSVEDRGGAIVPAGERGHPYDRVDIWMGSGDEGLKRALKWGKRVVHARVYESAPKDMALGFDLPASPKNIGTAYVSKTATVASTVENSELDAKLAAFAKEEAKVRKQLETVDMPKIGDVSKNIRTLQEVLIELGYLDGKSTGIFGEYTMKAIAKFQMDHKLVAGLKDPNAGKFGKITREKLIYETLFQGVDIDEIIG